MKDSNSSMDIWKNMLRFLSYISQKFFSHRLANPKPADFVAKPYLSEAFRY